VNGYLLDVNVLIALAWPNHVSHSAAHRWFEQYAPQGWATCPMTQAGFVRVSSNPAIVTTVVPPREAHALLARMTGHPHHRFWPDDVSLEALPGEIVASLVGHQQVTDAYLLALSLAHQGRLVTFDRGIRQLVPDRSSLLAAIVLIDGS
jgi:uncharacterized protein